jgi:hypothetical protein
MWLENLQPFPNLCNNFQFKAIWHRWAMTTLTTKMCILIRHIDIWSLQTFSHCIYVWNNISCLMVALLLCLFCFHDNRTWIQQKWMFLWLVDTLVLLSSHWFPRQSQVLNLVRTSWKRWQKEYRQVSCVCVVLPSVKKEWQFAVSYSVLNIVWHNRQLLGQLLSCRSSLYWQWTTCVLQIRDY